MTDRVCTFVATSIEGAAALWRISPGAMLEAIALHDAIVRAEAIGCGGTLVRRAGSDGFLFMFDAARDAIHFALRLRETLAGAPWPTEGEGALALSPAIGIAEGPVIVRAAPSEAIGAAISAATELAIAGAAGQIAVAPELAELARKEGVVDRPEVRPRRRRTNVGRERNAFVGRATDLERVQQRFAEGARLVTLIGPGGVGKTRLARAFARQAHGRQAHAGGTWLVELEPARESADVWDRIARACGIGEAATGIDEHATLGRALAARGPMLLVLDNCEHLIAHLSPIERLLEVAPELRVLATSRTRIGLGSEWVVPVAPLSMVDAAQLFTTRAEAAGATIAPAEEPIVHELVELLDRLPLAIELAAARARALPPAVLKSRLASGLAVLARARGSDIPDRHGTMHAVVRWSWDLLEPAERDAAAQCAVFAGSFTFEAAEQVLDVEDAAALIDTLVARSLLYAIEGENDAPPRFRMYAAVREFAAERLGKDSPVLARHAEHFLAFGERCAREMRGETERHAFLSLIAELDDLRAVCRRSLGAAPLHAGRAALALDAVVRTRGPLGPHSALLARVLEDVVQLPDDDANELAARVALALVRSESGRGAFESALRVAERALSRGVRAPIVRGELISMRGHVLRIAGRVDEARAAYLEALPLLAGSDVAEAGLLHGKLGLLLHGKGRFDEARQCYAEAIANDRRLGYRRFEAIDLAHCGLLELERGDVAEARELVLEALRIHRAMDVRRFEGLTLGYLALIEHEAGRLSEARAATDEALSVHRETGDLRFEGLVLLQRGFLSMEQLDVPDAASDFELAARAGERGRDMLVWAFAEGSLAALAWVRGDAAAAKHAFDRLALRLEGQPGVDASMLPALASMLSGGSKAGKPAHPALELVETRMLVRMLARAIARAKERAAEIADPSRLELGPKLEWLRLGHGAPIDMRGRDVLRRVLARLIKERDARPGHAVAVAELARATWPDEDLALETAENRIRVAIFALRKMGLKRFVVTGGDGYLIAPGAMIDQL